MCILLHHFSTSAKVKAAELIQLIKDPVMVDGIEISKAESATIRSAKIVDKLLEKY